jgi:hypothetical protein
VPIRLNNISLGLVAVATATAIVAAPTALADLGRSQLAGIATLATTRSDHGGDQGGGVGGLPCGDYCGSFIEYRGGDGAGVDSSGMPAGDHDGARNQQ